MSWNTSDQTPRPAPSKENDLVWLEGTNIHTTHPKVKLAPRRHRPFKVISSTPTNTKLTLPKSWHIHPVFHNTLLTPYKKTSAHGPNFARPPPEIVEGEDEHYKVETILQSRPTPNHCGIQYLVKWKGYPNSENSWLPASQMKHATDLVQQFHRRLPCSPKPSDLRMLQAQQGLKEGILLRTQDSVPSLDEHVTVGRSRDSLTPSGSRDSLGKRSPDRSRDQVTLPVQTRSRKDAHRVHNAKIGKQPSLAKDKMWEDSHGRSTDPKVMGRSPWSITLLHKKHH
jgi:hypothetical protein